MFGDPRHTATSQAVSRALLRRMMFALELRPPTAAVSLVTGGSRRFSLCLQGPPGTGKSAFVRHLAERMGVEAMQKRTSDLMSMWVGGTERKIADAFADAPSPTAASPSNSFPRLLPHDGRDRAGLRRGADRGTVAAWTDVDGWSDTGSGRWRCSGCRSGWWRRRRSGSGLRASRSRMPGRRWRSLGHSPSPSSAACRSRWAAAACGVSATGARPGRRVSGWAR